MRGDQVVYNGISMEQLTRKGNTDRLLIQEQRLVAFRLPKCKIDLAKVKMCYTKYTEKIHL